MSNPNTSLTQFQFDKRVPYGALKVCGIGLVLSPSAHVGSGNHGDMVLNHHVRDMMLMLLYLRSSCHFLGFLAVGLPRLHM